MEEIEVSTVVYLAPEDVYEFLVDFPRYANYSEHLRSVDREGDGSPGTDYHLTFSWWKLTYTAHTRVTDVDPPRRIDWAVVRDLDATGHWAVEPAPESARSEDEPASRVRFHISFRPESADPTGLDLPRFVPVDRIIQRVTPVVQREAERVVRRIVADLEGEARSVDLEIHARPSDA
ncbi:MAG: SRPBCC family protein [Haloarculaceae archaeon]